MGRLQDFLTHGAPLARFARVSSAKNVMKATKEHVHGGKQVNFKGLVVCKRKDYNIETQA